MDKSPEYATSIQPLVNKLVTTISREHAMLEELEQRLSKKLDAIRSQDAELLTETTHDISQTNQQLDALAQKRSRQVALVTRRLGDTSPARSLDDLLMTCRAQDAFDVAETIEHWQTKMRRQALRTQERCEEVTFALQYATRLGQEMLHALRGERPVDKGSGKEGYTADGTPAPTSQTSSLVNHVG